MKITFSDIITEIQSIQTIINKDLRVVEIIKESEGLVMGIIQNISEGKELSVVQQRVLYLQGLLSSIKIN